MGSFTHGNLRGKSTIKTGKTPYSLTFFTNRPYNIALLSALETGSEVETTGPDFPVRWILLSEKSYVNFVKENVTNHRQLQSPPRPSRTRAPTTWTCAPLPDRDRRREYQICIWPLVRWLFFVITKFFQKRTLTMSERPWSVLPMPAPSFQPCFSIYCVAQFDLSIFWEMQSNLR